MVQGNRLVSMYVHTYDIVEFKVSLENSSYQDKIAFLVPFF